MYRVIVASARRKKKTKKQQQQIYSIYLTAQVHTAAVSSTPKIQILEIQNPKNILLIPVCKYGKSVPWVIPLANTRHDPRQITAFPNALNLPKFSHDILQLLSQIQL